MRKTVSGTPAQARAYLDALKLAELPGAAAEGGSGGEAEDSAAEHRRRLQEGDPQVHFRSVPVGYWNVAFVKQKLECLVKLRFAPNADDLAIPPKARGGLSGGTGALSARGEEAVDRREAPEPLPVLSSGKPQCARHIDALVALSTSDVKLHPFGWEGGRRKG